MVFYKVDNGRLVGWWAKPRKRKAFQGSTMASGRDLPHDLAHFVVESALGMELGFWGLLARGATFKSVPGRRRTRAGRHLISANNQSLGVAEYWVNLHLWAWRKGQASPLGPALDEMYSRWRALGMGEELRLEWRTERSPHSDRLSASNASA